MRLMIKSLFLAVILNLVLALPSAWAGVPTEVVRQTIEQALDILKNPAYQGPKQKRARRQLVKRTVDPRFDFYEMAKLSLGPTWNSLSSSQREDFARLFGELLEVSYSDKIEKYAQNVRIDYVGEMVHGNHAEVKTIVVKPNDRIPLNYRLLQEPEGWKIYDVVIEGVSLVNNYRSQFSRIVNQSSYAELVRRLRTRVNEEKEMETM